MQTSFEQRAFLVLLALVSIAFFWIVRPFYGAVLWAVILAILFNPLQRQLVARFRGQRSLAALCSVLVCVVIAILPTTVIVAALLGQGAAVVQAVQGGQFQPPENLAELFDDLPPWAVETLDRFGLGDFDALRERLSQALVAATQFLASQALNVGQNTLRFLASLGIMLYVLFFLFRDGPSIGRAIRAAMPLSDGHTRQLTAKFAAVVRATVKGNVIIAIAQGAVGGVTFWLLGIQGALLWGVTMSFLSMVPAVGAALIWAPVSAYLLLSGDVVRGGALAFVGVAIISLIDNLLRPPLVGKETRLPDYVVLVSTLGGLSVFGINGFVLGPMVAALFFACWTLFREMKQERALDD